MVDILLLILNDFGVSWDNVFMQYYNRISADYLVKIDIPLLYEFGANWSGGGGWRYGMEIEVSTGVCERHCIRLKYGKFDYEIPLVTTACNYGCVRYWYECLFCKRRVGALYLRANVFACRHCQYLTYESKLVPGHMKGIGRIISIPEVEALEKKVKRITYAGKPTKNYIRSLNKQMKFYEAFSGHIKSIKILN